MEKTVAIYPGRFQPFGPHHYEAYKRLRDQFGVEDTYIATSAKTDPDRSPFTFEEKKQIAMSYGIPEDKIIQVKSPYQPREILDLYQEDTPVIFMYGEKDAGRLQYTKKDGTQGYFKEYDPNLEELEGWPSRGYVIIAPNISIEIPGYGEMSGTNIRQAIKDGIDLKQVFGDIDVRTLDMIKSKLTPNTDIRSALEEAFGVKSLAQEVYTEKQRKFMCAVSQPGAKRPKGLSKAKAEEMCKDTSLSKNENINEAVGDKTLYAFDLDDTLVTSNSNVIVTNPEKGTFTLTPAEYALYTPGPDDELDFSEFAKLKEPKVIPEMFNLFSQILTKTSKLPNAKTIILTARQPEVISDVKEFLSSKGLADLKVHAVGSSDPMEKVKVILDYIEDGYKRIRFYDDSPKNVRAVKSLNKTTDADVKSQLVSLHEMLFEFNGGAIMNRQEKNKHRKKLAKLKKHMRNQGDQMVPYPDLPKTVFGGIKLYESFSKEELKHWATHYDLFKKLNHPKYLETYKELKSTLKENRLSSLEYFKNLIQNSERLDEKLGDKLKNFISKVKEVTKREGKETGQLLGLLYKIVVKKHKPSPEEKKFMKGQSLDLGKLAIMGALQLIPGSTAITPLVVGLGKKYGFNVLPSEQSLNAPQKQNKEDLDEMYPPYKANMVQKTRYKASDVWTNDPNVKEGVPQPGESSAKGEKFKPGTETVKYLTVGELLKYNPTYYKEVLADLEKDPPDESWSVTKKVKEYAEYMKKNPSSLKDLPPINIIGKQLNDGSHRVSAIYLLQNLLDKENNFWKTVKLKTHFYKKEDILKEDTSSDFYSRTFSKKDLEDRVKSGFEQWPHTGPLWGGRFALIAQASKDMEDFLQKAQKQYEKEGAEWELSDVADMMSFWDAWQEAKKDPKNLTKYPKGKHIIDLGPRQVNENITKFRDLYDASPPELQQIVMDQRKAKQNPEWHPEGNTLKHIITVTNRAIKDYPDNMDIILAAYFHDLGKLATAGVNPKTGNPTAYGHEKESAKLVQKYSDFISKMGADPEKVEYLVSNHMKIKPSTWDKMRQKKKDKIQQDPSFSDLEDFTKIDRGGLDLEETQLFSKEWWKNIINENILNEAKANTHLTHLEELILTQGEEGYKQARSFLIELIKNLKGNSDAKVNTSVKWDGAPAMFVGINPDNGKFFVGTKSIFNKVPKINYTKEDVDINHGQAPGLADKLKKALDYLPSLGIKNVLQGDFMFDDSMIKSTTINDKPHLTFKPNTITYAVESDSDLGKQIADAKFGIVFHTTYDNIGPEASATFGADVSTLNKNKNVWFDDAFFKDITGNVLLTKDEVDEVTDLIKQADSIKIDYDSLPEDVSSRKKINLLNTYLNSEIRQGEFIDDPNKSFENFINWYKGKIEKEIEKIKYKEKPGSAEKEQKAKDKKRTALTNKLESFIDAKEEILKIFKLSKLLFKAKNIFIKKYNNAVYNTKHFVDDGRGGLKVTNPEGYVAVDRIGNGAKLVDRLEFSRANFAADKGFKN